MRQALWGTGEKAKQRGGSLGNNASLGWAEDQVFSRSQAWASEHPNAGPIRSIIWSTQNFLPSDNEDTGVGKIQITRQAPVGTNEVAGPRHAVGIQWQEACGCWAGEKDLELRPKVSA